MNKRNNVAVQIVPPTGVNALRAQTVSNPKQLYAGIAGTLTIAARGGKAPYSFALTSGALPTGMTLNGATGVAGPTPTAQGNFAAVVTVTDSTTPTPQTFPLTVTAKVLSILSCDQSTRPIPSSGHSYSYQLVVTGGTGTISFTAATSPSSGLSISTTGLVSASSANAVGYNMTTTATDSGTGATLTIIVLGQVNNSGIFNLFPSSTRTYPCGQTTTTSFLVGGGVGPYTIALNAGTDGCSIEIINAGVNYQSGCSFRFISTPPYHSYARGTTISNLSFQVTDSYGNSQALACPAIVTNDGGFQPQSGGGNIGLADAVNLNTTNIGIASSGGTATLSITAGAGINITTGGVISSTVTTVVVVVTTSGTVVSNEIVIVNGAATTQTLPAAPNPGDFIQFLTTAACTSLSIASNGQPIEGESAGTMVCDVFKPNVAVPINFTLMYVNATVGWALT